MNKYFTITNLQDSFKINIEFNIQEESWNEFIAQIKLLSLNISHYIFTTLGLNKYTSIVEYSITLTNDSNIQQINQQYLSKNKPTNVLSFPLEEIDENNFDQLQIHDEFVMLGDIIFSYETIKNETEEKKISFNDHFAHLLTHGLLHCLGYDHENEEEAERMEKLETDILLHFEIKSPYIIK